MSVVEGYRLRHARNKALRKLCPEAATPDYNPKPLLGSKTSRYSSTNPCFTLAAIADISDIAHFYT
ncbi:hypothetical protein [Stenomitos frigidus]|uniref:hypothetical protein n=1 Tax=Stenomitos frigidus TaxID=1886765 RepID=UPI0011B23D2B|nr:hypothetical protein [Stenomitos frigidus]